MLETDFGRHCVFHSGRWPKWQRSSEDLFARKRQNMKRVSLLSNNRYGHYDYVEDAEKASSTLSRRAPGLP
jgi:hypothetical protein